MASTIFIRPARRAGTRLASTALATVPCTLAGLSLIAHWGGGLYWLVPTALLGIVGAVYNAWILLVEIVR